MKYGMTAELEDYRRQVRDFVERKAPPIAPKAGVRSAENADELALLKTWTRDLFAAGHYGGSWPAEYGGDGPGYRLERDVILGEEIARRRAPAPVQGAANLVAHALIDFGTDAQKSAYLPGIRSGELIFCQLFSEPGAGSDLASLRTKAIRQDDGGFRISGQKVWTTNGQWADYGYLLARTCPEAPKHKGISAFIIDMRSPGVDVRPLREMTGTADFNEVFLDDVLVSADALIGTVDDGWRIANSSLGHERAGVASNAVRLQRNIEALYELAGTVRRGDRFALDDDAVRDRLGELAASVDALSALVYASLTRASRGEQRPHDAPMTKLMFSELGVEIAAFALELCGEAGVVTGGACAVDNGRWQDEFLYARAYTIAGGSSEIMRNIIAERGLGLPR
ncbi:acyl-CoA dehydrogenase [Gordonia amarae]|uniref:Acyl-CoA dehydrogenase n=2 Tax=Gordonia amarae TaxID=36821 RepID=A0A857MFJ7_9ACTN|nr:acyl-CoA dehydrogenase family protein [Gordonia amarae]QHN18815.1 acyl-CoA dehydrogenase [Gordonia amarae]QHN23290.1 acyl-CoA dehydrogenase [Gordonia amarae]QHN32191.1 acyl-CoA dehydrogenase [Gordonia amarae]QHN40938.1 acyl-CoA dehydrogenase [Gordonia amarae]